jgi:hypothetical protein
MALRAGTAWPPARFRRRQDGEIDMADGGNSNGFMGVILGAVVVGLLVLGFFVYTGRSNTDTLNVKIDAPKIETPGAFAFH